MSEAGLVSQVEVVDGVARVRHNGGVREFAIKELPESFVRWQLDYKHRIYDAIEKDEYVRFNAGHLPVVGTWSGELIPRLVDPYTSSQRAKKMGITEEQRMRIIKNTVDFFMPFLVEGLKAAGIKQPAG